MNSAVLLALFVGILLSTPVIPNTYNSLRKRYVTHVADTQIDFFDLLELTVLILLCILSFSVIAGSTFHPFIYYRF